MQNVAGQLTRVFEAAVARALPRELGLPRDVIRSAAAVRAGGQKRRRQRGKKRLQGEGAGADAAGAAARDAAHYQCSAPIALFNFLKQRSHEDGAQQAELQRAVDTFGHARGLAEAIVAAIELEQQRDDSGHPAARGSASFEVAAQGFVNVALSPRFLGEQVRQISALSGAHATPQGSYRRVPVAPAEGAGSQRTVVDYASPNYAKEMHVGHLRSTVIGESIARTLCHVGHPVQRVNHVGDWGAQFGMVISLLDEAQGAESEGGARAGAAAHSCLRESSAAEVEALYRAARRRFDSEPAFRLAAQEATLRLQQGAERELALWRSICDVTRREMHAVFERLGGLCPEERGESHYAAELPQTAAELALALPRAVRAEGEEGEAEVAPAAFEAPGGVPAVHEDDSGALLILPGRAARGKAKGLPPVLVARKSDGGFGYDATDLAAMRRRLVHEGASRVIYVTDSGQARRARWPAPLLARATAGPAFCAR